MRRADVCTGGLLLALALALASCSPSVPASSPSPTAEPTPVPSPTSDPAPVTPPPTPEPVPTMVEEDLGQVSASFDGEELDMTGAVVHCEIELPRVVITVTQASAPGSFWTTLWSTDLGVDVLDLGIGYGTTETPERARIWRKDGAETPMSATRDGETYHLSGATSQRWVDEAGEHLDTWPVEMTLTCPAS